MENKTVNIKLELVMNQLWISELEVNKTRTVTTEVSTYLVLTCICFLMCRILVGVLKAMLEKKKT